MAEKKTDIVDRFGADPIWPANSEGRYTVQFQLSCGYVIVNPKGVESTLGYTNKQQAECVAESLTEGHAIGKAEAANTIDLLRAECEAWRVADRYENNRNSPAGIRVFNALAAARAATDKAIALCTRKE